MKKIIFLLAFNLFNAQSSLSFEINASRYGGINYKRDHEINQFSIGLKSIPENKYLIMDEGHLSLLSIQDRNKLLGDSQWSLLVGASFVKGIDKYVGFEYGYYLGLNMSKEQNVIEIFKLGLTTRTFLFNPSINYQRINNSNYLGLGLTVNIK